jgi:hypothetical protein
MSKERELLGRSIELIDQYWDDSKVGYPRDADNRKLFYEIEELLAQPEQTEPLLAETKIEWYGKGFRQGVNEFAPPKPLTEDVIYALDKEGIVENMDDHQVRYVIRWIRSVEKAHGIGGEEE